MSAEYPSCPEGHPPGFPNGLINNNTAARVCVLTTAPAGRARGSCSSRYRRGGSGRDTEKLAVWSHARQPRPPLCPASQPALHWFPHCSSHKDPALPDKAGQDPPPQALGPDPVPCWPHGCPFRPSAPVRALAPAGPWIEAPPNLAPSRPPGTQWACSLLQEALGAGPSPRRARTGSALLPAASPGPGTEPAMILKISVIE